MYTGIILHHSACPSINGKGYDLFVTKNGVIIPSSAQTDPYYIHVCIEGDYSAPRVTLTAQEREQWFILAKLVHRLCQQYNLQPDQLRPHSDSCPGAGFDWAQLVISPEDRYH
ncbi:N-acetylmuramoyl-L-alanine amidase [Paenibacillus sp. YYML68]|uniref:peptidoglycan recognition protein family protein n=1 Tax=Paenibacillus sp. YYML68 TaxID=2909250 RepID=UPI0024911BC8|nr:N-acetylmuramoyl-L-alanine amidase [Paenibacillus sp. YYML68]